MPGLRTCLTVASHPRVGPPARPGPAQRERAVCETATVSGLYGFVEDCERLAAHPLTFEDFSARWPTVPSTERWFLSATVSSVAEGMRYGWCLLVPSDFAVLEHREIWASALRRYRTGRFWHAYALMDEAPRRLHAVLAELDAHFCAGEDARPVVLALAATIREASMRRRETGLALAA